MTRSEPEPLSPVDLPEPVVPLPHGLRWTTTAIAVATLVLALTNAHAIRGWAYQLSPNEASARVVTAAEGWYDGVDRIGLNRPFETMHAGWQSLKDRRFQAQAPSASPSASLALNARAYSSSAIG